jgi:hypothetical protein
VRSSLEARSTAAPAVPRPSESARRRARPENDDYQERVERSRERVLAQHAAANALRRRHGWAELPEPDLEPGWLERLRERAAAKLP